MGEAVALGMINPNISSFFERVLNAVSVWSVEGCDLQLVNNKAPI